jgi:hypothetical protein
MASKRTRYLRHQGYTAFPRKVTLAGSVKARRNLPSTPPDYPFRRGVKE